MVRSLSRGFHLIERLLEGRVPGFLPAGLIAILAAAGSSGRTQDYEGEPILYSLGPFNDPVAELQRRLEKREVDLDFDPERGFLPSVLRRLGIPASSQALVFSKTSFQRDLIAPHRPRAIYFNDSVYLGWVQGGTVLEAASMDPVQGTVFYTMDQDPKKPPRFVRQGAERLQCHASGLTKGVPGVLVRSVYPNPSGQPILKAGAFNTDHSAPLKERWGGWYVTGNHGPSRHLGNSVFPDSDARPEDFDFESGANMEKLADRFDTKPYLTPHSDIVALMVLEHQVQGQNLITSAGCQARIALHQQDMMGRLLGGSEDRPGESTIRRFEYAARPLLKYLFLVDEPSLAAPIRGTSGFAEDFTRRGPRDRRGRSFRDLDLTRRLFRYPMSYLVHSEPFHGLPPAFKAYLVRRLWDILNGRDPTDDFARASDEDRGAILGILIDTQTDLPDYWRERRNLPFKEAAPAPSGVAPRRTEL